MKKRPPSTLTTPERRVVLLEEAGAIIRHLEDILFDYKENPMSTKRILSADDILNAVDTQTEEVECPEWGGTVLVKALSGTERDRFEASVSGNGSKPNLDNIRAKLAALSIVNQKGERVFKDSQVAQLGLKSAAALDRVFDVARRLSGLRKEDVDTMTKNSSTEASDVSGSN